MSHGHYGLKVCNKQSLCHFGTRSKYLIFQDRPHQHNAGRSSIEAEQDYWKTYNKLASFSWPQQYAIERTIAGLPVDERLKQRQIKSEPILADFKAWLDKSALQVSSKRKLGEAINYSLNQWGKLKRYTESGLLNIDNNRAEWAVKPFVIGRENWLFNINHRGAETSAMLYSIIETAKANGLIPFDYINHCLEALAKSPTELDGLLPWNVKPG